MNRFTLEKRLIVLLLSLLPMIVQALPFVPTTSPTTKPIHWYYLKVNNSKYVYSAPDPDYVYDGVINASSSYSNDDKYLWCFVGNSSTGYKIYNRAAKLYMYYGDLLNNGNESAVDYFEAGSGDRFYIYFKFSPFGSSQIIKNYLCYSNSEGFYTTMGKDNTYYTLTEAFVEEEVQVTAQPSIDFVLTDTECIITARGDGEVHLYVNNNEVNNPYHLARTNVDQMVSAKATAQEPGKEMNSVVADFVVPAFGVGDEWTRYDINGVGYRYVNGGQGNMSQFSAKNLCDGNADTKFFGLYDNCWVTIEAESPVLINQYSLVTANDSREQYSQLPCSWTLQGSNDNFTWTDIDKRKYYPMPFADKKEMEFYVDCTQTYKYFKFIVTNAINNDIQLSEVWINGQDHNWGTPTITDNCCGNPRTSVSVCSDCNAIKTDRLKPITAHSYQNGTCTVCGQKEKETMLLYNGQNNTPNYVKSYHGMASHMGSWTWPTAPEGWSTANFDDSKWDNLPLPTANPGHSDGPFTSLQYNSYWFNEYNCYYMRFPFTLAGVSADDVFTLRCVHDDNMWVYVNGEQVLDADGWTETPDGCTWESCSQTFTLPASAFHAGKNVLGIYIQQNWGGAYFDCSLSVMRSGYVVAYGDVDGSGIVDVDDVNALINIILELKPASYYSGKADLDGSGIVDVDDVNAVINVILGT